MECVHSDGTILRAIAVAPMGKTHAPGPEKQLSPNRYPPSVRRRTWPLLSAGESAPLPLKIGVDAYLGASTLCGSLCRIAYVAEEWRERGGPRGIGPVAQPVDYIASGQIPVPGTKNDEPNSSHRVRRDSGAINGHSICVAFVGDRGW